MLALVLAMFALIAPRLWLQYTDPTDGASWRYPPSWMLATDPDGSHGTPVNPATRAVVTVAATTVSETVPSALSSVVPDGATSVSHRTVAGDPALDFVLPIEQSGGGGGTTDRASGQFVHLVVVAVRNRAGTTNLYQLALTAAPSDTGDDAVFEGIVGSFAPSSSSWPPLPLIQHADSETPGPLNPASAHTCDAICWADANWSANDYLDDASGRQCASYDNATDQYVRCTTSRTALPGAFQPDYQCAEFAARALAQVGLIPGLSGGGYGSRQGPGGGSGEWGGLSYNSYPFTAARDVSAAAGDTTYNLLGVGIPGTPGLYDYLVTSGIGVDVQQRLASAAPGDLVFFYDGSANPANREHVMLITSLVHFPSISEGIGGWDALLDGHNRAAYHSLLSTLVSGNYPFAIVHLRAVRGSVVSPATAGTGWTKQLDGYGQSAAFVATTSAADPSASAYARIGGAADCELAAYVPNEEATARVTFQLAFAGGGTASRTVTVDEAAVDGWVLVDGWTAATGTRAGGAALASVMIANNTGTDRQVLGVGPLAPLCAR